MKGSKNASRRGSTLSQRSNNRNNLNRKGNQMKNSMTRGGNPVQSNNNSAMNMNRSNNNNSGMNMNRSNNNNNGMNRSNNNNNMNRGNNGNMTPNRMNPGPQSVSSNNSFNQSPPKRPQYSNRNVGGGNNMNRTPPRGRGGGSNKGSKKGSRKGSRRGSRDNSPRSRGGVEMDRSQSPNFTPNRSNMNGSLTSTPKRGMSAKQRKFYERLQNHKRKKASSPSPIKNSNVQVNRGMEVHYDSRVPEQEKIFDPNKSINLMAQDPYA